MSKKKKGKKKKSPQKVNLKNFIEYVCLGCKIVEKVPKHQYRLDLAVRVVEQKCIPKII
jgi:hypothetical protein